MPARLPSFRLKLALLAGAVAAADVLLWRSRGPGLNVGLMALALAAILGVANPAIRRDRLAGAGLAAALVFAALQIERPTAVGLLLYVLAMGVAALAPRAARGDDGFAWAQRLAAGGLKALACPLSDLLTLLKARSRRRAGGTRVMAVLLPLVGGLAFLGLFALANPVIAGWVEALRLPAISLGRLVFWGAAAFVTWTVLRPRGLRRTLAPPGRVGDLGRIGVTPNVIVASLAVFNLVFGLQNGLDIAYLWSGAGLPAGVSFAEYAHRGAYPLITTAMLAGLFVLVFLHPGSASAGDPRVRALVIAWTGQNLFLVASTALRTLDYVDAYSLTRLRIAALLWMGLVAVGLVLVLTRMLAGRSPSWLINANLAATGLVLAACSVVDLGAITAEWNVRHAAEVGGRGAPLDLCYLRGLHGAALVPLAELERRSPPGAFRDRVASVRNAIQGRMAVQAADWRTYRWRDARRLDRAEVLVGGPAPRPLDEPRGCDGAPLSPPRSPRPAPAAAAPPLTPAPNAGT